MTQRDKQAQHDNRSTAQFPKMTVRIRQTVARFWGNYDHHNSHNNTNDSHSPSSSWMASALQASPLLSDSTKNKIAVDRPPSCNVCSDKNNDQCSHLDNHEDGEDFDHNHIEDRYESKPKRRRRPQLLLKTKVQMVWYQSKSLKARSKIGVAVAVVLIVQYFVLTLWDALFHRIGDITSGHTSLPGVGLGGVGYQQQELQEEAHRYVSSETSFAVVINTYKRPERLHRAVQHYADTCGRRHSVSQVFVVWAEQGVEVPEPDSFFHDDKYADNQGSFVRNKFATTSQSKNINNNNRSQVYVLQKSKDSLNSRFEPIEELQTTSVFMVDDDIRVSCSSLELAFDAWRANPRSMVGFYPRLASPPVQWGRGWWTHRQEQNNPVTVETKLVYHAWPVVYWRHRFNFVLTKACFLHSRYLTLYTNDKDQGGLPREIKDHVDKHKNCEDIAMSMLVANYTASEDSAAAGAATTESRSSSLGQSRIAIAPPIYVEGDVTDQGLFGGISTGTGHMATRSECLTELTKIFVANGWGSPLLLGGRQVGGRGGGKIDSQSATPWYFSLSTYSWIHHSPGFWFQYRPSNVFEWLAFANTFS